MRCSYKAGPASAIKMGWEYGDLSWTLEDNELMNNAIMAVGGKVYKRFRIYEKPFSPTRARWPDNMDKKQLLFIERRLRHEQGAGAPEKFPQFEVTHAGTGESPQTLGKGFDVVITDIYVAGFRYLESSSTPKKNKETCVIIITGADNADLAAKALKEAPLILS